MDTGGSLTDSCDINGRQSIHKFLAKFRLPGEENRLNYAIFREICATLFPPDEIKRNEWRIEEVFCLFDQDRDGILKGDEWKMFCNWLRAIIGPVNILLVVDVQNDFIDGFLALRNCKCKQDGLEVVEPINRLIKKGFFDKIIYSQDWHPEDHISFYENLHLRELHPDSEVRKENAKPFDNVIFAKPYLKQTLWPKHCLMNTWGSQLHQDLVIAPGSEQVRKGQNPDADAYSVFMGYSNGATELEKLLGKPGPIHLYVCGLAYDICVAATCLDGLRLGYAVATIDDCCRGTDAANIEANKKLISENGGLIVSSDHVLSLVNDKKRSLIMSHQSAKAMASISLPENSSNISE